MAAADAEVIDIGDGPEEQAAALKLQAMRRGKLARREVELKKETLAAAEVLYSPE